MPAGFMAVLQVNLMSDSGGVGISRFHVQNSDNTALPNGPATVVANALAAMYGAVKLFYPTGYHVAIAPTYTIMDVDSAIVHGSLGLSPVPADVIGTGNASYPAGTGCRGYWHTATLKDRRVIRGATYFTPLSDNAYSVSGAVVAAAQTQFTAAMNAYLATLETNALTPVIYSRPAKGEETGGVAALITGASVGSQIGSLRSRRH